MMVYGVRVRQARELSALTQKQLADRVGVTQARIAQIERGEQPSLDVLDAIAFQTRFPRNFFYQEPFGQFPQGSLIFRARKAMTAREATQVYRHGEVIYESVVKLAKRVNAPPLRLPQLDRRDVAGPEEAAAITRSALGLAPDAPIQNLINAVERAGVIVIALPLRAETADAYSLWAGALQQPVIVTFQGVPGDRLRLSVAHELGHLVMHPLSGEEKAREKEAYDFAGALLVPADALRAELVPPVTLTDLVQLKPRWRVSIAALIMRAHKVGVITDRQQRYLFQQLSQRGWKRREPPNLDIPAEKPRAMRKMVELIYGDPPDFKRLAGDLNLSTGFIRDVIDGHASLDDLPKMGVSEPPRPDQPPPAQQQLIPDNVVHFRQRKPRT